MSITLRAAAFLSALGLAACAAGGVTPPSAPDALTPAAAAASGPPSCKGQSTTSLFATATAKLATGQGMLCIPSFRGYGGAIAYPAAHPAVNVTVTASTTNYNHLIPTLSKGKPEFFIQIATSASTTFGSRTRNGAGLESAGIKPGKSYDLYGEAKLGGVAGITVPFTPCVATAAKGKYGGVIGDLGGLMEKAQLLGAATIYLEVFPGGKLSAPC